MKSVSGIKNMLLLQKLTTMRKLNFLILITLSLFYSLKGTPGSFEGSMTVIKESCYDTTYFTYLVAQGWIRIEESDSHKNITSIYIINTDKEEVFAVNPSKKLYTKLKSTAPDNTESRFEIKKTKNSKVINGVKCFLWRVKNREKNTEIAYWVTQSNFDFFDKMVKILNYTDRNLEFFSQIPQSNGFFPILCVERNLVRDEKMRTSILEINRKPIDTSLFRIPNGYKNFVM